MEKSVSVLLSSKIDACQQPSAQNIQICREPFIPFFCCFYSIICSEKVEARVTLKFSLNIIPAIHHHQLNILWLYHPHFSHTNLILAKIFLVSHCFTLKTIYNFAERQFEELFSTSHISSNLSFDSVKHLICIPLDPLVQCVLLYSTQV